VKAKVNNIFSTLLALLKNNPHFFWALILPVFLACFFLLEIYGNNAQYWVSYTPLDDKIPFLSWFIIPYCMWYPSLFAIGLNHLIRDADAFRRYMWMLYLGFFGTLVFCLLFPNGQDLRVTLTEPLNVTERLVRGIYSIDTNTNVLPSMHVVAILTAFCAVLDSKTTRRPAVILPAAVLTVLITLSTVFTKQHSVLDIYAAAAYAAVLYVVVYVFIKRAQLKRRARGIVPGSKRAGKTE
jgi:membrane-associated phospholipid phosphatase